MHSNAMGASVSKTAIIIDVHTHAGRPNRIGDVDRDALATLRLAGVAAAVVSAIGEIPMIRRLCWRSKAVIS